MKILLSVILAVLVFVSTVVPQTVKAPDLSVFTQVGARGETAFLVDNENVTTDGAIVSFRVLVARISGEQNGKTLLDPENYLLVNAKADCSKFTMVFLDATGVAGGKPVASKTKDPKMTKAEPNSPGAGVVGLVCDTHVGTFL